MGWRMQPRGRTAIVLEIKGAFQVLAQKHNVGEVMTHRYTLDGYMVTESDTRVTMRPITDADRYAFLKTLPHHKADRIISAEPDSWDAIIDNAMKENTK